MRLMRCQLLTSSGYLSIKQHLFSVAEPTQDQPGSDRVAAVSVQRSLFQLLALDGSSGKLLFFFFFSCLIPLEVTNYIPPPNFDEDEGVISRRH